MRQPRQGAVGDCGQLFELKLPARLPGKRRHDAELEVTDAGFSLQLGIEGCRQQGEGAHELEPSTPLVMVQPADWLGRLHARILSRNKLTLQVLGKISNLKLQLQELNLRGRSLYLLVLGATGRTGRLVVEQALAAGHTVTALVRSPQKLTTSNSNLRVVTGDVTDTSALAGAMERADAVISTLGGKGSVIADSTQAIVAAAREARVSRIVVLSSWVVERDRMDTATRLLTRIAMARSSRTRAPASRYCAEATSNGPSFTRACLPTARPTDL